MCCFINLLPCNAFNIGSSRIKLMKPNITTQERKDILQKILLLKNMSSPTPKVIKQIQQLQQQL